jgi:hypothetical protein
MDGTIDLELQHDSVVDKSHWSAVQPMDSSVLDLLLAATKTRGRLVWSCTWRVVSILAFAVLLTLNAYLE